MIHDSENEADMSENLTVGAYGWRHHHWQTNFYDQDLPEEWQLAFYANEFSSVLIPSSYLDASRNIAQWCDDVNDQFRFYIEWPQHEQDGLFDEVMTMGDKLGGILLNLDAHLEVSCPVYDWHENDGNTAIWEVSSPQKTDLAVLELGQSDLRLQRQWLESFVEDSEASAKALLVSDIDLDIKKLRDLKTLVELKGF